MPKLLFANIWQYLESYTCWAIKGDRKKRICQIKRKKKSKGEIEKKSKGEIEKDMLDQKRKEKQGRNRKEEVRLKGQLNILD